MKSFILSLGVLLLVSYIDYATSDELVFFVFYFIPVSLCAWYAGRSAGLGMALLSGIAWWLADRLGGRHYLSAFSGPWNGSICFLAFAVIGLAVARLKQALDKREQTNAELSKALGDLRHSNERIRELQNNYQVICDWTKQIQIEGRWIPIEQFLTDYLNIPLTHGITPAAARALAAEFEDDFRKAHPEAEPKR
ncbi:MAG TPA: hypothetical protein VLW52_03665 [Opitutaceae bacterium]|nr:hypothetical protein [Opitutaceae bacterium]